MKKQSRSISFLCSLMGLFFVWCTLLGGSYAQSPESLDLQKTFSVQPGGRLVMDVDLGEIEIRTGESSQVQIEVVRRLGRAAQTTAAELLREHEISFDRQDNDVIIRSRYKGKRFRFWGRNGIQVRYLVLVPPVFDLDLKSSGGGIKVGDVRGDVRARSSGGGLNLGRIDGPLFADSSGGGIQLESCNGKAEIHSSGGGINVAAGAGDMIVESSGGSVKIVQYNGRLNAQSGGGDVAVSEINGSVDASSSGGSVSVAFKGQPTRDCRLHSSGGGVAVEFDDAVAVNIDAVASGGRVVNELPVTVQGEIKKESLRGKLNGGGPTMTIVSSGGGVHLRKRRSPQ